MEYMCKSLEQAMSKLSPREVINIMAEVALGMAVAHDNFIIHSDMKPGNILVSDDLRRCTTPYLDVLTETANVICIILI